MRLHEALVECDFSVVTGELLRISESAASSFDLTSENGCHMLLGLLFNMRGYADPISNREYGLGRPDIRLEPVESSFASGERPLIIIDLKYAQGASSDDLEGLAEDALRQIEERHCDEGSLPAQVSARVRWGVAYSGKRVVTVCDRA